MGISNWANNRHLPASVARIIVLFISFIASINATQAQLPVSGIENPEVAVFDNFMQAIMSGNGISAGVLAVSDNGVVVYQRGFGVGIPENIPMRVASVSKPITAAAIQTLIADENFDLELTDRVFGLGTSNGILPHLPYEGSAHPFVDDVTIADLLNHQAGWDHDIVGDPQFMAVQIAQAIGIPSPPDRDEIIRFMLSQPMQYFPGTNGCINPNDGSSTFCYSNFAYLVLGRVVEEVSGVPLHDFFRNRLMTPNKWVANQELFTGRSLGVSQDPREPFYQCTRCNCQNVFDPNGRNVPCPYGGFNLESFVGHGNLVASAVPLLRFMDDYIVAIQSNAGLPIPPNNPNGFLFQGSIDGTNSAILQRSDGINIVVLFNKRDPDPDIHYAGSVAQFISGVIDTQNPDFSDFDVDGYWVDFNAAPASIEVGGFTHPYRTINQVLNVGDGAKIRLKPGTTSWTGTISNRVVIDAPLGTASIGN